MKFYDGKSVRKQQTKFLTQANEAGSSTAMEALGHKETLTYLLTTGMVIKNICFGSPCNYYKVDEGNMPQNMQRPGKTDN